MVNTASLFTQILSLFQRSDFARHVRELKAERHARGFTCWSQFVVLRISRTQVYGDTRRQTFDDHGGLQH